MAAAAAAAVGPSLSTSLQLQSLKCIRSAKNCSFDSFLRMSSTKIFPQVGLVVVSHIHASKPFSQREWRVPRISVAVAQEEAAAAAAVEAESEEGKVVEEVPSGGTAGGGGDEIYSPLNTKLYFGNLPYNFDSAQLAGLVQPYGVPELVEVLYDRDTGRSRGYAFVTMSSVADCNAVIQTFDGKEYGGRILRVNFSDKPKPKEPLYPETEYKLFVGNLAWSVTSESLTEVFRGYGKLVGARVLYDGETGRSRGYGFVCYSTKSEMENVLRSLDGAELEGRAMRISIAEGKRQ